MPIGLPSLAETMPSAQHELIPGLVWAFRIHADATPEVLLVDDAIDIAHGGGLLWIHLNLADARSIKWLKQAHLDVPEQARTLLLSNETHQQVHSTDECVFGVMTDLLRDIDATTDETGYLRFLMTEGILVSGRHHALCAVDATRRLLENGRRVANAAELLETIVENVAGAMESVADRIALALDQVEEHVLSGESRELLQKLGPLRRTCVRLHRQLSGLRVIFQRLEQQSVDTVKAALRLRAAKLAQRLDGLDHRIVEMRERSRLLQEELHLQISEQSNESLRVLSILTALLLPPTLVTGIFGMNTKGLPLTDVDLGFVWAGLLIVLSSVSAYVVMKRIGLIR